MSSDGEYTVTRDVEAPPAGAVDLDVVGWVVASKHRRRVLLYLFDRNVPVTPAEVRDGLGMGLPMASRTLKALRGEGLVELCVPPETVRGKRQAPTARGERVAAYLATVEVK